MKTKQGYYQALKEGNVPLLEELAIEAGFKESINLRGLPLFEQNYSECAAREKNGIKGKLEPDGISLTSGPSWVDPTNYLRIFEKGFVRTNNKGRFVAGGLIDKTGSAKYGDSFGQSAAKVILPNAAMGGIRLIKNPNPEVLLYGGKFKEHEILSGSLVKRLQNIGADRDISNVYHSAVISNVYGKSVWTSMALMGVTLCAVIPNNEYFTMDSPLTTGLFATNILTTVAPFIYFKRSHDSHYGKNVVNRLYQDRKFN